jgi:hypothetical protein
VPGRTYRLEFIDDLTEQGRTALGEPKTASTSFLVFADPAVTRPARFYRVLWVL